MELIGTVIKVPEKYDSQTIYNGEQCSLSKIMKQVRRQQQEKPQRRRSLQGDGNALLNNFVDSKYEQLQQDTTANFDGILELNELAASLMPPKIAMPAYEPPHSKYNRRRRSCCF
mmetsp:Transcript_13392/g.19729  ORF Transcript_13392/g.19729 Transcript_13392/m.19729 type:complete len:115 (-) Transcript_13392:4205-4549(-)